MSLAPRSQPGGWRRRIPGVRTGENAAEYWADINLWWIGRWYLGLVPSPPHKPVVSKLKKHYRNPQLP